MVRKGGFEPPRLSAPPPQDGVSASSTTSAGILIITKRSPVLLVRGWRRQMIESSGLFVFDPEIQPKGLLSSALLKILVSHLNHQRRPTNSVLYDGCERLGIEACAAHQRAVNFFFRHERCRVLGLHGSAIQNAHVAGQL